MGMVGASKVASSSRAHRGHNSVGDACWEHHLEPELEDLFPDELLFLISIVDWSIDGFVIGFKARKLDASCSHPDAAAW